MKIILVIENWCLEFIWDLEFEKKVLVRSAPLFCDLDPIRKSLNTPIRADLPVKDVLSSLSFHGTNK